MRLLLGSSFLFGFVGVLTAALGAHALSPAETLSDMNAADVAALKQNWRTGTSFLFFHILAAIACVLLLDRNRLFLIAGWFFLLGGALFSAGLWLNALTELHQWPMARVGVLSPIGGISMMIGWLLGTFAVFNIKQ